MWWWWRFTDIVFNEHVKNENDSHGQSSMAHPHPSPAPNSDDDDSLGEYDTIVYTNEPHDPFHTFAYTHTEVTEKVATRLLNAKINAHYTEPPVQTLTYDINKDLKVWALRNRILLPINEMLLQSHNIKCRGPVVVSRCNTRVRVSPNGIVRSDQVLETKGVTNVRSCC